MNEHIYKKVQIIGTSTDSMEQAIRNAVERASSSLRNLRWFEVDEIRGSVQGGKVHEWQVGLKLAFTLEQGSSAYHDEELNDSTTTKETQEAYLPSGTMGGGAALSNQGLGV